MKNKILMLLGIILCIIIVGFIRRDVYDYDEKEIIEKVLKDSKKEEWLECIDDIDITIHNSDLLGDEEEEAIAVLSLDKKNTIVSIYNKDYEYIDTLGTFYDIEDIMFIPLISEGKNILVFRDKIDQMFGAFEKSSYIYGYIYIDGFKKILNILENYDGYIYDKKWLKISQRSKIVWENSIYPVLNINKNQYYSTSDKSNESIPNEEDFIISNERYIYQKYYYNEEYKDFILGIGIDKTNGEEVAIKEDLSNDPFYLAGFINNMYKVVNKKGNEYYINKNDIIINKNIKKDRTSNV